VASKSNAKGKPNTACLAKYYSKITNHNIGILN
jgi:hypothetical protein